MWYAVSGTPNLHRKRYAMDEDAPRLPRRNFGYSFGARDPPNENRYKSVRTTVKFPGSNKFNMDVTSSDPSSDDSALGVNSMMETPAQRRRKQLAELRASQHNFLASDCSSDDSHQGVQPMPATKSVRSDNNLQKLDQRHQSTLQRRRQRRYDAENVHRLQLMINKKENNDRTKEGLGYKGLPHSDSLSSSDEAPKFPKVGSLDSINNDGDDDDNEDYIITEESTILRLQPASAERTVSKVVIPKTLRSASLDDKLPSKRGNPPINMGCAWPDSKSNPQSPKAMVIDRSPLSWMPHKHSLLDSEGTLRKAFTQPNIAVDTAESERSPYDNDGTFGMFFPITASPNQSRPVKMSPNSRRFQTEVTVNLNSSTTPGGPEVDLFSPIIYRTPQYPDSATMSPSSRPPSTPDKRRQNNDSSQSYQSYVKFQQSPSFSDGMRSGSLVHSSSISSIQPEVVTPLTSEGQRSSMGSRSQTLSSTSSTLLRSAVSIPDLNKYDESLSQFKSECSPSTDHIEKTLKFIENENSSPSKFSKIIPIQQVMPVQNEPVIQPDINRYDCFSSQPKPDSLSFPDKFDLSNRGRDNGSISSPKFPRARAFQQTAEPKGALNEPLIQPLTANMIGSVAPKERNANFSVGNRSSVILDQPMPTPAYTGKCLSGRVGSQNDRSRIEDEIYELKPFVPPPKPIERNVPIQKCSVAAQTDNIVNGNKFLSNTSQNMKRHSMVDGPRDTKFNGKWWWNEPSGQAPESNSNFPNQLASFVKKDISPECKEAFEPVTPLQVYMQQQREREREREKEKVESPQVTQVQVESVDTLNVTPSGVPNLQPNSRGLPPPHTARFGGSNASLQNEDDVSKNKAFPGPRALRGVGHMANEISKDPDKAAANLSGSLLSLHPGLIKRPNDPVMNFYRDEPHPRINEYRGVRTGIKFPGVKGKLEKGRVDPALLDSDDGSEESCCNNNAPVFFYNKDKKLWQKFLYCNTHKHRFEDTNVSQSL